MPILLNINQAEMPAFAIVAFLVFIVAFTCFWFFQNGHLKFLKKELHVGRRGIYLTPGKPEVYALPRKGWMRRPLVERGNSYRNLAWRVIGKWVVGVIAIVFLFFWIFALFPEPLQNRVGIFIFLAVVTFSVALFIGYFRAQRRCAEWITKTTACPHCGKVPMAFVERSDDSRMLLVCNKCQIEWDLGPYTGPP